MGSPTTLPEWHALEEHRRTLEGVTLRELFANDPDRARGFTVEEVGLTLDLSKHRISHETLRRLFALARACELEARRAALFGGQAVNVTEHRAALHMALRHPDDGEGGFRALGAPVMPAVREVLARMRRLCDAVRGGAWRGFTDAPIRDVVNLGIGGSDLGPRMAVRALSAHHAGGPRVHFVSNVDGAHLYETLQRCDPHSTLFVVASKTFTTQETMANAHSARAWMLAAGAKEAQLGRHFVAVTVNQQAAAEFGIVSDQTYAFWDWVGGRFSLWSAIGLPVALAVGMDAFEAMLAGAHQMDQHFLGAPFERNMPVLMALVGVWYTNFFAASTLAVLPYDQRLEGLVPYLQQLEMESNGKRVARGGSPVGLATAPVLWGAPGTDGQHAFFQLLHQGPALVPVDFIGVCRPNHPLPGHQRLLMANLFAQSAALMNGKNAAEVAAELTAAGKSAEEVERLTPHKVFPGNRPSTTLLLPDLSPENLGRLCALYEHKVFCQGVVWGINSFDQWGVELGKEIAGRILGVMDADDRAQQQAGLDASTRRLVARWHQVTR